MCNKYTKIKYLHFEHFFFFSQRYIPSIMWNLPCNLLWAEVTDKSNQDTSGKPGHSGIFLLFHN